MAKSAADMTSKFKSGISQGGTAYVKGVQGTPKDPIALAIAAAPKWGQKTQEAIANGSYAKGLQRSSKGVWTANSVAAQSKFTGSADTAASKYSKYATVAAPMIAQFQQEVDAMPSLTDADMEQRALAMIKKMRTLKGTRG